MDTDKNTAMVITPFLMTLVSHTLGDLNAKPRAKVKDAKRMIGQIAEWWQQANEVVEKGLGHDRFHLKRVNILSEAVDGQNMNIEFEELEPQPSDAPGGAT